MSKPHCVVIWDLWGTLIRTLFCLTPVDPNVLSRYWGTSIPWLQDVQMIKWGLQGTDRGIAKGANMLSIRMYLS